MLPSLLSMNINYNSIASIKQTLKEKKIAPRKLWGQNYLINENIRQKIIESLDIKENEKIWEIGPGLGAMTDILLKKTNFLTTFEIDPKYSEILNEKFGKFKNFKLIKGDFLKKYINENKNIDKIFSNLPYNIASKVISKLIEENFLKEMVLTVQKELADRITAKIHSKNYSSFTVLVQSHFTVIKILDIGENNFYPVPKVKSTTLKLIPKKNNIKDFKEFNKLVRTVFSNRRKKLKNTIINLIPNKATLGKNFLKEYLDKRPENISVEEFIQISNTLNDHH
ncbi:16S rRNA (adenine(1518)-N(6)/adenine(1519)-N(6))-dimethyltransferase RsmA [Borrelia sp. CA_690]|uniref:Ribosomal RNA small subunit methyltransferase A n=1 Tax=Borrelia maritima TaxID=2761123 RepID=A0A5J6WDL4_9SPIR|nr:MULTISPECIES: 16S rRNA (adenine(1518)-N(6)/adenine(1519)-N(6))-dimethyltransferase RsmA [Borrelia]QFI14958.1 16S rRNA (adenine(1518)-N(6)/adenine(1519)-N(6))-dimethyltransferase RsmA [Borrelia maritima]WKC84554.1 16S rRNA (adenine(1518)-N(6)/adenine(1519)-N(6))-dimethyltransferase RsmA [Borrelia sp. CA_690]